MPSNNAVMAVAAIAIVLAGASLVFAMTPRPSATTVTPTKKAIWMATLEPTGSANVRTEPFPDPNALAKGGGMRLDPPDAQGNWRSVIYRLDPGTIVVNKGDEVTLNILGVNGRNHSITVDGYVPTFFMKRGELKTHTFTADRAGAFEIWCSVHPPNMRAQLVVQETP